MKIDLVVTRHKALIELMIERGICPADVKVISHIEDPSILDGKVVAGVLPLHLAARCAAVVVINLRLTAEDRGVELTLDRLRIIAERPEVFRVAQLDRAELAPSAPTLGELIAAKMAALK